MGFKLTQASKRLAEHCIWQNVCMEVGAGEKVAPTGGSEQLPYTSRG